MDDMKVDNIILDEKTKKMIIQLFNQIKSLENQIDVILQTVVNTKFPNTDNLYELSEDLSMLIGKKNTSD